jgi:hypothetical protein
MLWKSLGLMMKKYSVELTEKQVKALINATDLMQRIELGQFREIETHLPLQKPVDWSSLHEDFRLIGSILSKHMIDGIDGGSSSLGIGHPSLPETNSILYDIHCVLRNKLSWEDAVEKGVIENENSPRKFPEMMQTWYDTPMKYSTEDLPVIKRIEE